MFERNFIENFLKDYSKPELEKIAKDLKIVEMVTFETAKPASDTPVYLATAGGPGSGKTTTLESFIAEHKLDHYVYADPDQVSLKNMLLTYRKALNNFNFASAPSGYLLLKQAYDKWRGASNYICHEMLQTAFGESERGRPRYSVAHGTTSTSPHIETLYQKIKARGYRIVLLLCYCQDETRKQAITRREREQAFVQVDPSEVISKGVDFSKRFDIYFKYANEIYFYWNDELTHGKLPTACAKLVMTAGDPALTILNETGWINFCKKYLQDTRANRAEISRIFEQLIPRGLRESESAASAALFQVARSPESKSLEVKSSIPVTIIDVGLKTRSGKVNLWDSTDSKMLGERPNTFRR